MPSRRDFLVRFAQAGVALSAFRLQRPALLDPPPTAQGGYVLSVSRRHLVMLDRKSVV